MNNIQMNNTQNASPNIDYGYFINPYSSRRRPAITRELTKMHYNAPKDAISLAEGMPNEATFPFESITVNMKDGNSFVLDGFELSHALQYIGSQGYRPLLKTLKEFIYLHHKPPMWESSDIIITIGSQDGISKTIEMCIQEGEPMVVQNPFYAGTESVLKPFKPTLLPVDQDQLGMIPEVFEAVMADWKAKCDQNPSLKMPKLLYINPTASNPTGTTLTLDRRQKIYDICCKYNILILEDDPYYFIHFMESTTPSFLSIDREGRVIRFDSFSKILCPGLRVGCLIGPQPLVRNLELHVQSSYLHCSSLSQAILNKLFEKWTFDKLMDHLSFIRDYYRARRDLTLVSMERHLKGLCEWTVPSGGMFVWIKVKGIRDIYDMLMTRGQKKLVTFVPGHVFMADPAAACNYIRASFSKATPVQIDKAMKLLAELIKEEKELINRKLDNCT